MHGGPSTGARTPEGKDRARKAAPKHGHFSAEAVAARQQARANVARLRELSRLAQAQERS
jgi:hypothetical protein